MTQEEQWIECPECKGWGTIFITAGIPNKTIKCSECKGTGRILLESRRQ